ncbi:hypothetical protein EDC39_11628 [Geothermobacter ehrlichii]|uniref:Uncharacterized protein n=1 Tax=Geothermobacter ehrlichii TaxID=213224 RepID=A0A5D3WEW5_9BACT|nr:hypothetical protein [Geothermobacter ehrlichii]TYO95821.1 hypothetical protein EDC39_11628 [Geothermobacter ehrlichii]
MFLYAPMNRMKDAVAEERCVGLLHEVPHFGPPADDSCLFRHDGAIFDAVWRQSASRAVSG